MEKTQKIYYTYMVRCRDDSLYTGYTTDLSHRVQVHNKGDGAKYTKSRRPVKLVYYEEFSSKSEALSREYAIKQLTRGEKLALIANCKMDTVQNKPYSPKSC